MKNKKQFIALVFLITVCVFGHFLSPSSWHFAHQFLFKFTYLPIILGAIWYGRWFAMQLSALFCLVYLFHIILQLYQHSYNLYSIFLDLGLYFIIAWITGKLNDTQKDHAQNLDKAYLSLKEKTSLLLEFEENAKKTERLKTMGELAGVIAHEVRTPLSALQGAVEIVVSDKSNSEVRTKYSKVVYQEVQRINTVVNDFLKLGTEKNLQTEKICLNEFMTESMTLMLPILRKNNIELMIDIPKILYVQADIDQLKQVLINLIMNSISAITSTRGKIEIFAKPVDAGVEIWLVDNGQGVHNSVLKNIFSPFVSKTKGGSGLGLYLSRNIIRSFGGELFLFKTKLGRCEFRIKLRGECNE